MRYLDQPHSVVRIGVLALAAAAAVLALSAVLAASASAQQPAICEQYPQLPECQGNGVVVPEGPNNPDNQFNPNQGPDGDESIPGVPISFPGDGGPSAGPGAGAGGALPFTGYPLTPLLLLLLILLAAGLLIRGYLAARERWRLRQAGAPYGTA
ncbi:MAG: hypothetical protein ACRDKX_02850 [Solirubrobacterales bacterium]